jgi:hypothetical protein
MVRIVVSENLERVVGHEAVREEHRRRGYDVKS